MSKIKFSFLSFLGGLFIATNAYATTCATDADCAPGESCVAVASAECPPCAEGSACDSCATELLACVPASAVDCGVASGSGSGAEGSAAADTDCGSGDPAASGSGSGEATPVAGSGSGADTSVDTAPPWGDGSGAAVSATKSDSGCSTAGSLAGGLGIFAGLATVMYMRRRKS